MAIDMNVLYRELMVLDLILLCYNFLVEKHRVELYWSTAICPKEEQPAYVRTSTVARRAV